MAVFEISIARPATPISRVVRTAWAMLLARIYDQRKSLWDEVFPLTCPKCGGTMCPAGERAYGSNTLGVRIIAFINEGGAIREILLHLGEPTMPPGLAPARGPPLWEAAGQGGADPLGQPMPEFEFDQRIAW